MKFGTSYAALLDSEIAKSGLLRPIKWFLRPFKNLFESFYVGWLEINGPFIFPKQFDRKTRLQFLLGIYEPETAAVFKRYLTKGMTVLDIGANFGYYTWLASGLVGEQGSVLSFEPEPANYELLEANIKRWNKDNIVLFEKAVSEHVGHAVLQVSGKGGCHSLVAKANSTGREIEVDTVSVDALAEEERLDRVDFIKIDIEGAELLAFKGMKKTIEQFSPVIIFELNPGFQSQAGYSTDKLISFLKALDYSITYLEDERELERKGYLNVLASKAT